MRLTFLARPASLGFTLGAILFAATLTHVGALVLGMYASDFQHGEEIAALASEVARLNARLAAKPSPAELILDNESCTEAWRLCHARKRTAKIKMKGTM